MLFNQTIIVSDCSRLQLYSCWVYNYVVHASSMLFFIKYCKDSSCTVELNVYPHVFRMSFHIRVGLYYPAFVCRDSCLSSYWRSKALIQLCVRTHVVLSIHFLLYISSQASVILMLLRSWLKSLDRRCVRSWPWLPYPSCLLSFSLQQCRSASWCSSVIRDLT
jgi:hypothetical protein